ncbi:SGNH hydrolase-type esterase domain-containing protein [Biscogniauxia sp. FL1348]|nr:SGNH hydrolase-type esterase domain-containing protein [Biscogniauxia sp. FL1348]
MWRSSSPWRDMDKLPQQLSSSPIVSMVLARKRLLLLLFVPLILIIIFFSGSVDGEWSQRLDSLSDGIKNGVKPIQDTIQDGFHYVTGGPEESTDQDSVISYVKGNTTIAHGNQSTVGYVKSEPYKRPGFELPLANGIPFRIMALGASTTRGDCPDVDIDNNGFRRPLREKLTAIGNPVNFVGTQRIGNMTDNDIEAYPGIPTHIIHEHAQQAVPPTKPNLFLINAGSNDCFQHIDIPNFYKRYDALVQYLLEASPRSTVVMCTILPTWDTRFNGREDVWRVNPQIRKLAKIYEQQGLPVVFAEMQGPDGIQDENLGPDGMHPATPGYEMMATKMFHAIVEADAKGFLQRAEYVPGILDDGNEERMDEEWLERFKQQQEEEDEARSAEEEEIENMKAELAKDRAQQRAQKVREEEGLVERRFPRLLIV